MSMYNCSLFVIGLFSLISLCSCGEDLKFGGLRGTRSALRPTRVTYSDIERANKTCPSKDSCARSRNDRNGAMMDWKSRNCFCDQQCIVFEDCCVDSPFRRDPNVNYKKNDAFTCTSIRQFGSLYMRTKCPPNWKDETIRSGCEDARSSPFDPVAGLPVTNAKSGFTYRNYACALCNNQTFASPMEVWRPRLECPGLSRGEGVVLLGEGDDNLLQRLEYRAEEGSWGLKMGALTAGKGWSACTIDPVVPTSAEHLLRSCLPSIKDCPLGYNNTEVHRKCLSYTATVYHLGEGYRNPHCALCNGIQADHLTCDKLVYSRNGFSFEFNQAVFATTFDLSPRGGNEVGRNVHCQHHQIYDPFFQKCRAVLCLPGQFFRSGQCLPVPDSPTTHQPFDIITVNELGEGLVDPDSSASSNSGGLEAMKKKGPLRGSRDFEKCPKIILDPSEYTVLGNGSVWVSAYSLIVSKNEYAAQSHDRLVICSPASKYYTEKFGPALGYISFAGVLISTICILLHLLASAVVPELRNLSGKNLSSLCVALLLVYIVFLALPFIQVPSNTCTVLAVILYYSFMAAFCWMLVLSWDVSTTLRKATQELRISTGSQWTRFFFYSIFGWLFPALLVSMSVVAELLPVEVMPWPYSPNFGRHTCWFGQKPALLIYFAGPVAFILLLNVIMFIDSARVISTTSKGTAKAKACAAPQKNFRLYLRLALLMGLSWILGIVAGYVDIPVLWIIFTLVNTLQGLFIFIAFTCSEKVRRSLGSRLCCSSSQNPASWTWSGGHHHHHGNGHIRSTSSLSSHLAHSGHKRSELDLNLALQRPRSPPDVQNEPPRHCQHSHSHRHPNSNSNNSNSPPNQIQPPLGKIYRSPSSELYRADL